MLCDCHSHLVTRYFSKEELEKLLQEMKNEGISAINVAEIPDDFQEILEISKIHTHIVPFLGLHPIQISRSVCVQDFYNQESFIIRCLETKEIKGIGEIGLDFSPQYNLSLEDRENQVKVFEMQLKLALKYNVPVNVHSRNAGHYAIESIAKVGNRKVIMHAFDGSLKYVIRSLQDHKSWFYTIAGTVARIEQVKKMAANIPINNLLLETDAPALPIVKQTRSSPLQISQILEIVMNIKSMEKTLVMDALAANWNSLFL
jgi:TatD DNase family protein